MESTPFVGFPPFPLSPSGSRRPQMVGVGLAPRTLGTEGMDMATASTAARFNFGARPHRSPAAAARYFDALARFELAGRTPTPAQAREIITAQRAYVRCSLGLGRNTTKSMVGSAEPEHVGKCMQFNGARQREHRSASARATVGRDDGEGGESQPSDDDVRDALLNARMHGCTCTPNVRRFMVNGNPAVRLGHQLTCPRLKALRANAGVDRLAADVVTPIWRAGR
jgi:hypothetical protein